MLLWLEANLGTILVSLVLAALVALAVLTLIRQKRSGKSACGCGCGRCAMAGKCHSAAARKIK